MFCWDENGQLQVKDYEKLEKWLNYKPLHMNKIPLNNRIIQKVINKFYKESDTFKLYNKLRMFYWYNFIKLEDFEDVITKKLENDKIMLDELFVRPEKNQIQIASE